MEFRPIRHRFPGHLRKPLERIVLHDSGAEHVESDVGDQQRGFMGGIADLVIEEMGGLAYVDDDGDVFAIWMAEAVVSARAKMENVAVDEGEVGFGADVALEAVDAGVVEPDHEIVAVDEIAVIGVEEDSAISDDGAGGVSMIGV